MLTANTHRFRSYSRTGLAAGSALMAAILLSGCSSVPNAINPVHWYDSVFSSGDETTPVTDAADKGAPADASGDNAADHKDVRPVGHGLSADHSNAKYTQEALNREGTPTRPLNPEVAVAKAAPKVAPGQGAPEAQAAATTATPPAGAAVPAPAPVQTTDAAPPPPAASAPESAPAASAGSPAPAVVASAPVPAPVSAASSEPAGPETVEQAYQRRLREFAAPVVQPAASFQTASSRPPLLTPPTVAAPAYGQSGAAPLSLASSGSSQGEVIHLIPPHHGRESETANRTASGARPLASFDASRSAASFDLATLRFGEGTSALSDAERAHLRDVAALYREQGGTLRVIAASSSPRLDVDPGANREANRALARTRADAVVGELVRLGVPARKIYAGVADGSSQMAVADGAVVLLDM